MKLFTARINRQGDLKASISSELPAGNKFAVGSGSDAAPLPAWTGPTTGWNWSPAPPLVFETATRQHSDRSPSDRPPLERQPSERDTQRTRTSERESRPVTCTRRNTIFACLLFGALIACGAPFWTDFGSPSTSETPPVDAIVSSESQVAELSDLSELSELIGSVDAVNEAVDKGGNDARGTAGYEEPRDGASSDEEDDLDILIPDSTPEQRADDDEQEWVQEADASDEDEPSGAQYGTWGRRFRRLYKRLEVWIGGDEDKSRDGRRRKGVERRGEGDGDPDEADASTDDVAPGTDKSKSPRKLKEEEEAMYEGEVATVRTDDVPSLNTKGADKPARRGRARESAVEGAGKRKRAGGQGGDDDDIFGAGEDDDAVGHVPDSGYVGSSESGRAARRRDRARTVDIRFGDKEAMRDLYAPPVHAGEDEGGETPAVFRIPEDGLPHWDAAAAKRRAPECQHNEDCNRGARGNRGAGGRRRLWCVDGMCKCPVLWAGSASCSKRTPLDDWCLQPMDSLSPPKLFFDKLGARTNRTIFSRILNRASGPALNRSRMDQFTLNLEDEAAVKLTRGSTRYMIGRKFGAFQLPQKDIVKGLDLSTCAVVGNSDSVLQHKDGAIIDAHATIIRFNEAPTAGYEPHVGSKTSIRIQNKEYSGFAEDPHEICLVKLYQYFYRSKSLCRVIQFSPQFQLYALRYWSVFPPTHWPGGLAMHTGKMSSGFMGLAFALHVCGHVSVFGMSQGEAHYFLKFSDKIPVAKLAELERQLNATTTREEARALRARITEQRALIRELKAKQRAVREVYDRDIYRWGHPRRGPHPSSHAHEKRHPWEVEKGCMRTLSMLPSVTHYS